MGQVLSLFKLSLGSTASSGLRSVLYLSRRHCCAVKSAQAILGSTSNFVKFFNKIVHLRLNSGLHYLKLQLINAAILYFGGLSLQCGIWGGVCDCVEPQ